jgi:hypothetical protein
MREFQKALCTTTTEPSSPGQREGLKKSMINPPRGLQSTEIAARLRRKMTNVGCHSLPSNVQTYEFRSWEEVTILLLIGAQSMPETN